MEPLKVSPDSRTDPLREVRRPPPAWPTRELRAEAVARVAAYFRGLGTDAETASGRAESIVASMAARPGGSSPADLLPAALEEARRAVELWLDGLLLAVAPVMASVEARAVVASRVRCELRRFPRAFLAMEDPPGPFLAALGSFDPAVVPPRKPTVMPAQPLGQLPLVLSFDFWRGLGRRLRAAARQFLITLAGG